MTIVVLVVSAIAKAFMDLIAHGKIGANNEWWRRKWKNGDRDQGEAFPLSSTVLVFLTDPWHALQFVVYNLIFLAMVLYKPIVSPLWDFVILGAGYRIVFEVVYRGVEKVSK